MQKLYEGKYYNKRAHIPRIIELQQYRLNSQKDKHSLEQKPDQ